MIIDNKSSLDDSDTEKIRLLNRNQMFNGCEQGLILLGFGVCEYANRSTILAVG